MSYFNVNSNFAQYDNVHDIVDGGCCQS